ncbi:Centrosomal protein of 135 kDa [Eumeta japonica]|uniref:Centrosomal protein of 135 kDa n=1 Tax=Eumeta variegata TaxID=151549 RepID=A0A4C1TY68_EUMVA|nr:Centrosomal protein of 135 kDa [Eumeta japonica]
MSVEYFNLKRKLEDLGYNNKLPVDAVPLVECITDDLLQTTKSLQHYMELSKGVIHERDSLVLQLEPYKCDNARLLKENNELHKEIINIKEEYLRLTKEHKRKVKYLSDSLLQKEKLISRLQHDLRDLSLRGLCSSTLSSRNKSKRINRDDDQKKFCYCGEDKVIVEDNEITELKSIIQSLEEQNEVYSDEILILKKQVEHRDSEISRLYMKLESEFPVRIVGRNENQIPKIQELLDQLHETEANNELLKKEINTCTKKQHEAMLRALKLADENRNLHEELKKVDSLALEVEEDCNKRLAAMMNEVNLLHSKLEDMITKSSHLEKRLSQKPEDSSKLQNLQEKLNIILKEKDVLKQEIKDLLELNKSLQDKLMRFKSQNTACHDEAINTDYIFSTLCEEKRKCATKDDLRNLLENERKIYEKQMAILQDKLNETTKLFNRHLSTCNDKQPLHDTRFIKDLQRRLCESDQKILMLKKENDDLKANTSAYEHQSKQNYKDIINQLNTENAEVTKENISLSKQLSQCKNVVQMRCSENVGYLRNDIETLKRDLENIKQENQILKRDKKEIDSQLKDATNVIDKLKLDLNFKQKQLEQSEEENCSYRMTNRSGRASAERLKEECDFLREQIKKMQNDVMKEKTLASQIRNIQMETERSSSEMQSELLHIQKQLSLAKESNETLEKKCKDLQSEISSLKSEKLNLIDNLKKVDHDRDKLVIELDQKTETICALEQKLKTQSFEVEKLEKEIVDLKRKMNLFKISEHKLIDTEAQIKFLNGENVRLSQQLDNAIIENKHLQNSLADANGTLKITKIEYDKSRKEVESLKQQLQHYVAEVRRIEELLAHKESERSDMLEKFASLSVEANLLENTNNSLENESASKSVQLQHYVTKIKHLESQLVEKEDLIDRQTAKIASMSCKITVLENEVKLINEEKSMLEKNISYLKKMCVSKEAEKMQYHKEDEPSESELQLYENKIKVLSSTKAGLEVANKEIKESLKTTEKLLSNARQEIIDLKLALQDATSETKMLHDHINTLNMKDSEIQETLTREALESPLLFEEEIQELHQDDELRTRYDTPFSSQREKEYMRSWHTKLYLGLARSVHKMRASSRFIPHLS